MLNGQRFPFREQTHKSGDSLALPYLPLILVNGDRAVEVVALVDTGASVSVLPYEIGLQLGAVWEEQTVAVPLSGNLQQSEARGLILTASITSFSPVLLAFAWSQMNDIPVILGHMNFLAEFNVCFYRHELIFEISPQMR
ncbi:MAG: hypothetical protein SAJ12_20040 [Jaaginema sp. PMC 1079.18]|nr:hypothetical protein [Jaaginema sp. PMC 1080.18]MEC4853278.1 hypothetical protein [Jaaginema sp. PMC 1079.18]MEC4868594.1 hypothetical protein [Jaaginema sp. PMC 1078.18]